MKYPIKTYLYMLDPDENSHDVQFRRVTFPKSMSTKPCSNFLNKEPHNINKGDNYRFKVVKRNTSHKFNFTSTCIACLNEFYESRGITPNA